MTDENNKKENKLENTSTEKVEATSPNDKKDDSTKVFKAPLRKKNVFHAKGKGKFKRQRPKAEFQQKIVNISRVTRVVKGGRRLSFRVDMVIGDKRGRVGVGSGKAGDTSIAIEKAYNKAKKKLMKLDLSKNHSIPYEVKAKFCASKVNLRPNGGRGLVAGSAVRNVLELAGVTDVTAKVLSRSENKLNNAKATFKALEEFKAIIMPAKISSKDKQEDEKKDEEKTASKITSPISLEQEK